MSSDLFAEFQAPRPWDEDIDRRVVPARRKAKAERMAPDVARALERRPAGRS